MPNVHHITVTMRGPRDIAIDVPGACQVRCLGPDAFSRAARLFCEVEGGEDWPETAGLVTRDFPRHEPGAEGEAPTAGFRGVRKCGSSSPQSTGLSASVGLSVHSEGPNGWNRRAL